MPRFTDVRTDLPGPVSRRVLSESGGHLAGLQGCVLPVVFKSASGATLIDMDGNRFLDLGGGGAPLVGHSAPRVVAAAHDHVDVMLDSTLPLTLHEPALHLASRLSGVLPIDRAMVALFPTPEPALEAATALCRTVTGRVGTVDLSADGALVPATMPYCYRCPHALARPDCQLVCAGCLIETSEWLQTAAVICRPIATGTVVVPGGYGQTLTQVCRQGGALLIADETDVGLARSGSLLASDGLGLEPDLVCATIPAGAALSITGLVGPEDIMCRLPGTMETTRWKVSSLACRAALEVLEVIDLDDLSGRASYLERVLSNRFQPLVQKHPQLAEVRVKGAIAGLELVADAETGGPDPNLARQVVARCLREGLMLSRGGVYENVVLVLPPPVITDQQLQEALEILEGVLADIVPGEPPACTSRGNSDAEAGRVPPWITDRG